METTWEPLIGSEQQIKVTRANSIGPTVYRSLLQVNPEAIYHYVYTPVHILRPARVSYIYSLHTLTSATPNLPPKRTNERVSRVHVLLSFPYPRPPWTN